MKLSKDELEFALSCAKSYYYQSSESDYPNKTDKENEERYRDLENALDSDKLEIEGYERDLWIKLDPNNPDTFPPRSHYFFAYSPGHMSLMFRYSDVGETNKEFARRFTQRYGFTHWRPVPPPVETEKN